MLNGRWWILPDGSSFEITGSEHAVAAARAMLKLAPGEEHEINNANVFLLDRMTDAQAKGYKRRGVPADVLAFLRAGYDPRDYAMQKWGWIRTAGRLWQMWRFDDASLRAIQAANDYWRAQTQITEWDDAMIEERSNGNTFEATLKRLRNRSAEADAIKHVSMGVGRFGRNPVTRVESEPYVIYMPLNGTGAGQVAQGDRLIGTFIVSKYKVQFETLIPDPIRKRILEEIIPA